MEPAFATDPELEEVLAELSAREPIFHRPEFGTTRADFERMMGGWRALSSFDLNAPTTEGAPPFASFLAKGGRARHPPLRSNSGNS